MTYRSHPTRLLLLTLLTSHQIPFLWGWQHHLNNVPLTAVPTTRDTHETKRQTTTTRRNVVTTLPLLLLPLLNSRPSPAVAAATTSTTTPPQEFKNLGTQAPPPTGNETPFITLPSGVKTKDFKLGTGDDKILPANSRIFLQCTGRLLNLNGVIFYSTKNNDPTGFGPEPLVITTGRGEVLPGLEEGLVGMKRGGVRRIIVPQELAYNGFPDLEPRVSRPEDRRALDSVVKNPRRDGAILFDVSVERIK